MVESNRRPAKAAKTPDVISPVASDATIRTDKRVGDEIADKDLDNASGGIIAVLRTHSPI